MASSDDLAIETSGLTKRFAGRAVVDSVDLRVPEGSVFGFIGPNGSGKTTTIRMLLGLAFPTAGRARVLGADVPALVRRVLPEIGTMVEGPAFYPWLSGRANLRRMDAVGPAPGSRRDRAARVEEALGRVGLLAAGDRRYRHYSLGMRQRLSLGLALLRPRRLLVLDEPTNGLDPQGMREVRSVLRSLATGGTTVFVSSHLLAEVEQICTHAAVLRGGRLVAQGSLEQLRSASRPSVRVTTPDVELAERTLIGMLGVGPTSVGDGELRADLDGALPEDVTATLVLAGVRVRALASEGTSLEDAFMALTGEGFDVGD